ncbi:alpha/beta hydrolase [Streptomyces sp. NPDC007971]|uniref:alpha/beta hydrolase n=1 Tax=Streptomyces sp. NPDC007971 TaxID=3364799 RepID=UPI0036E7528A
MVLVPREIQDIERANISGRKPVVFVHGLWLLAGTWRPWCEFFEEKGYAPAASAWPDDPETVEQARARPEVFARKRVRQVVDHTAEVIRRLNLKPAAVGHSMGGLVAQILAGRGLSSVTVAIGSAPFRGVLALPVSALKAAMPVVGNPLDYRRSVALTYEQFRFAFANAVSEKEARELYEQHVVAASGVPLFQASNAAMNPLTEVKVDTLTPQRGPLLHISGEKDHFVPWAISNAAYKKQKRNPGVTALQGIPDRGHSLVFDSGWRDVAEATLAFIEEHQNLR